LRFLKDDDNNEICAHVHADVQLWRNALKEILQEIGAHPDSIMKGKDAKVLGYDIRELLSPVS
jgi:hypothetical protein